MMRRLAGAVAAGVVVTVFSTGAWAQQPGQDQQGPGGRGRFVSPLMAALDADGDGVISAQEIEGAAAALKKLDKDGDGKLSGEEIRPSFGGFGRGIPGAGPEGTRSPGGGAAAFVARMLENDKNNDGKLAKDELSERQQFFFDRADTNKDGFLDQKELEEMAARFSQFRPGSGRPGEGRPGEGRRRPEGTEGEGSRPRRAE